MIAGATGTAMADHYYGHGGGGYYGGGGGYYSGGDYQPRHKARRHCFWVQQRFRDSYGGWFYKPVKVCE